MVCIMYERKSILSELSEKSTDHANQLEGGGIHLILEGYYAYNFYRIGSLQSVLGQL